jgi:hypothetical protein
MGPNPGRAGHFIRHLPGFGWEAIVLTPRHPQRRVNVEKTREHRDCPIPLRRVLDQGGVPYWLQESAYKDVVFSLRQGPSREQTARDLPGLYGKATLDPEAAALASPPVPRTLLQRAVFFLKCNPDARAGWVLPGLQAARAVCRALRPDAVYSISPPVTSHRIAMRVAENLKIPWIADLREPWRGRAPGVIDSWRRTRILRGARAYRLPPSFDPNDLAEHLQTPSDHTGTIALIHAGSTAKHGRDPLMLCDAIRHLLDAKVLGAEALRVRVFGAHDPRLADAIAERFLSSVVTLQGEVPWEISLEIQAYGSALLLALGPGDRGRIPDRLMDAFAVRRPVIAFGQADASLQELLTTTGIGGCYTDSSSLASALADLVRMKGLNLLRLDEEALDPYRAERVVEGVVKLLSG